MYPLDLTILQLLLGQSILQILLLLPCAELPGVLVCLDSSCVGAGDSCRNSQALSMYNLEVYKSL